MYLSFPFERLNKTIGFTRRFGNTKAVAAPQDDPDRGFKVYLMAGRNENEPHSVACPKNLPDHFPFQRSDEARPALPWSGIPEPVVERRFRAADGGFVQPKSQVGGNPQAPRMRTALPVKNEKIGLFSRDLKAFSNTGTSRKDKRPGI